jgi:RNAse (barnase) inhibitor barstar
MTITIDGDKINNLEDFYNEIEKHFFLGDCPWGHNLDSLEEIVQYNFNCTENKDFDVKEFIWLNSHKSKENLGVNETVKWLTNKLNNNSDKSYNDELLKRIERIEYESEQTLFEIIIRIFQQNSKLNLILK